MASRAYVREILQIRRPVQCQRAAPARVCTNDVKCNGATLGLNQAGSAPEKVPGHNVVSTSDRCGGVVLQWQCSIEDAAYGPGGN